MQFCQLGGKSRIISITQPAGLANSKECTQCKWWPCTSCRLGTSCIDLLCSICRGKCMLHGCESLVGRNSKECTQCKWWPCTSCRLGTSCIHLLCGTCHGKCMLHGCESLVGCMSSFSYLRLAYIGKGHFGYCSSADLAVSVTGC